LTSSREQLGRDLPVGRAVRVRVPATSANLGPGFDSFALAVDWYDEIELEVADDGFVAQVSGEGAVSLPTGGSHLVIRAARRGFEALGVQAPGLRLRARNTIPQGRGLGSSSAAIVSGLLAACGLAGLARPGDWLLRLADEMEGHPDNVAAAIFGGFVLAYRTSDGLRAVGVGVHERITALAFIPHGSLATVEARRLLPERVPLADAASNAARAGLLVHALSSEPSLLFDATRDWLHQDYRAAAMPESAALVRGLRGQGFAAVVSGAGPAVLVLGRESELERASKFHAPGFFPVRLAVGGPARLLAL
jgi:homoserine kinase